MFGLIYLLFDRNPDIEFETSLSVDECRKRLMQELLHKRKIIAFQGIPPIVERLDGNNFLISRNHSFFYRDNSFVLDGRLKTANDGTIVRASFRLYEGTSIILILGFGVFFGMAANEVFSNGVEVGLLLIPVVLWAFIGLILWLMLWWNKRSRKGLAVYLQSILMLTANSTG